MLMTFAPAAIGVADNMTVVDSAHLRSFRTTSALGRGWMTTGEGVAGRAGAGETEGDECEDGRGIGEEEEDSDDV